MIIPLWTFANNPTFYKVFYNEDFGKNGIKIKVEYEPLVKKDTFYFHYDNNFWGEKDFFNCLKINEKDNPKIKFKIDKERRTVLIYNHKSNKISLTYSIHQDFKDPDYNVFFRPRMNKDYFHVLGRNLFLTPQDYMSDDPYEKHDFYIDWFGFPDKYLIHNNLNLNKNNQHIKANLDYEFYSSIFMGGDYRIHEFDYKNGLVKFAVRDTWHNELTDEFMFQTIKNAVISQRDFWKDYDKPYFSVSLTPTVSQNDSLYKGSSTSGTAIKNGFFVEGTNNPFNSKDFFSYLIHHELMHNWIGKTIVNKNEELQYWFSEGFTDYYTHKNRLRIKEISIEEWKNNINEIIRNYWNNPDKNIPNYQIKDDFWKSRTLEKVPYNRGAIFAFWLDNQILLNNKYEKSLDDLMRELLKHCKENNVKFTDDLFLELAEKYTGKNIAYFFQKHVISGVDFELDKENWIEGITFLLEDNKPKIHIDTAKNIKYIID